MRNQAWTEEGGPKRSIVGDNNSPGGLVLGGNRKDNHRPIGGNKMRGGKVGPR